MLAEAQKNMKKLNDWVRKGTVRLLLGSAHLWTRAVRAVADKLFGIEVSVMVLSISDTSAEKLYLGSDLYVMPAQRVHFLQAIAVIHDDLMRRWQAESGAAQQGQGRE